MEDFLAFCELGDEGGIVEGVGAAGDVDREAGVGLSLSLSLIMRRMRWTFGLDGRSVSLSRDFVWHLWHLRLRLHRSFSVISIQ